ATPTRTNGTLTITRAPLAVAANNQTKIYGAVNPSFTGTLTGVKNGDAITGTYTTTATQTSNVGTYAIVADVNATAAILANYTLTKTNGTLTITPQTGNPVASTYYTGSSFFWTTGPNSSTATLNLVATLKDDPNYTGGDIRTAKVSFYINNNGTMVPITGAQNLPVGLVNPGDITVGTAAANVQYNIGSSTTILNIAVVVTGNYKTVALPEDKPVTVAIPTPGGLIAGGSTFDEIPATAGYIKGTSNFAFFVQYNKSLTNPQGRVEMTVFSKYDRNGNLTANTHTYKLKSTAISVLSTTNPTAQFSSKANLSEIVNGVSQSIEGNCSMQLNMYDGKGNLAVTTDKVDRLAITVYRSNGGIWYSSNWDGTKTILRDVNPLDEVTVGGAPASTTTVAARSTTQPVLAVVTTVKGEVASNLLEVYPNPLAYQGTIHFHTQKGGKAQVYLYNQLGALVATLYNAEVEGGQDYYLPLSRGDMAEGVYTCRLITNGKAENKRITIVR
ncbi:MBG domain-containing protein, partial [Hymenobacter frigidus]